MLGEKALKEQISMARVTASYVELKQGDRTFLLTKLPARVVTRISYAAVRGQSEEKGAIQRILNPRRITGIKDFTLQVGHFPNAIVLNWVSEDNPIATANGKLSFSDNENSAQIIDGQHRIAGIRAAIEEKASIGNIELPVVIYQKLSTQDCADIFLSINTEQKPVPRSLVFDLYGVASEPVVDPAAVRARDIAMFLNETEESPYYGEIKLPNTPIRKGGIALSTAVTAIKPLVEDKGAFEQIDIRELEPQRQIILNFFLALREKYKNRWDDKDNVFMYAAGFVGAMDFLKLKLIPYGNIAQSFTVKTIRDAISLSADKLILQEEVKGLGGKDAPKKVYERLVDALGRQKNVKARFEI